jgi:hypothetical protein
VLLFQEICISAANVLLWQKTKHRPKMAEGRQLRRVSVAARTLHISNRATALEGSQMTSTLVVAYS